MKQPRAVCGSLAIGCLCSANWEGSERAPAGRCTGRAEAARAQSRLASPAAVSQCYTRPSMKDGAHALAEHTRGIAHEALCAFSGKGITTQTKVQSSERGAAVRTFTCGTALSSIMVSRSRKAGRATTRHSRAGVCARRRAALWNCTLPRRVFVQQASSRSLRAAAG